MRDGTSKTALFVLFQLVEAAVFVIAFVAGMIALEDAGVIRLAEYQHPIFYGILLGSTLMWNRLLNAFDLYLSRRLITRSNEVFSLLFAVVIAAAFLALLGALLNRPINEAVFLVWFMLVAIVLIIPGRLIGRLLLRTARAYGRNLRFVAIVGAGTEGQALARHIQKNPQFGFQISGLFDAPATLASVPDDLPQGGTLDDLSQVLMREPVDEVLIALPIATHYQQVEEALKLARRTGVSARVTGGLLRNCGASAPQIQKIGNDACLHFDARPNWGWQGHVKRLFDIIGAGMGILTCLPVLVVMAILIKLDSRGPVFFVQTRVGKDRKHFKLLKLRTMTQDAEAQQAGLEAQNEAGGPVFKIKSDPRITRLGHFLRKYSIDELPQLFNVLKGDMSLVGPRPLPLRDVERFEHDWHSRRFSVRPGLTCSWVLMGRSQLEFDSWVRTDLDYIDNWSLSRDIYICLRTVPAVLRGSGAY